MASLADSWFSLLSNFGFGILSSLTPCVYPLIPVTLAIFGATQDAPRIKAFLLSLVYVLGIALTYTALGMFSAKTGAIFGQALGNTWVVLTIAIFFLVLSLFSIEVIQFRSLHKLQSSAGQVGGAGFGGAFVMGALSGVVAAPCVGPILLLILTEAAKSPNIFWGGALLFSYSMGLGLIFIVLGTFSGLAGKLPRSGNWLHLVKIIIAAALVVAALNTLQGRWPQISYWIQSVLPMIVAVAALLIALFVGWIALRDNRSTLKIGATAVLGVAAFALFIPPPLGAQPAGESSSQTTLKWHNSLTEGLATAKAQNTILMVDLFAEWCAACKELDHLTFSNSKVQQELSKLTIAREDFTVDSDATNAISAKYDVIGLPSILFIRPDGSEIKEARITGFLPPEEYIKHLNSEVFGH